MSVGVSPVSMGQRRDLSGVAPVHHKAVGDGEDRRADKDADEAEGHDPAHDAEQDQQQRHVVAALDEAFDQIGFEKVIDRADDERSPHEHKKAQRHMTLRIKPDGRRNPDGRHAHRDKGQEERQQAEERGARHAADPQAEGRQRSFQRRGAENAVNDADQRAFGDAEDARAARAGEALDQRVKPHGHAGAVAEEEIGDGDAERDVQQAAADHAAHVDELLRGGRGILLQIGAEARLVGGEKRPDFFKPVSDIGDAAQHLCRVRRVVVQEVLHGVVDLGEAFGEAGADDEQRNDEAAGEEQRHQGGAQGRAAVQLAVQPHERRPGGEREDDAQQQRGDERRDDDQTADNDERKARYARDELVNLVLVFEVDHAMASFLGSFSEG